MRRLILKLTGEILTSEGEIIVEITEGYFSFLLNFEDILPVSSFGNSNFMLHNYLVKTKKTDQKTRLQ